MKTVSLQFFVCSLRTRNAHGHVQSASIRRKQASEPIRLHTSNCTLCKPAQSKRTWACQKILFCNKCQENLKTKTVTQTLCNPTQSKRRWICQKIRYMPQFSRKKLCLEPPEQRPALTITLKNCQCRHTAWRKRICCNFTVAET